MGKTMKELPKTGDIFYTITINKGIVTKSNPMIVKDKSIFALTSYEFTDGDSRYNRENLFPCHICGGPENAPIGLGDSAFIYALEKDVKEATKFLIERYIDACLNMAAEATRIADNLKYYSESAKYILKNKYVKGE